MTTSSRALPPGFRCAQCGALVDTKTVVGGDTIHDDLYRNLPCGHDAPAFSWTEQVAEAAWAESRAEREVWRAVDTVTVTVPPPWISWTAE